MGIPKATIAAATAHLHQVDPALRRLMPLAGPFRLRVDRNRFRMLASSIIGQQLSVHAARTIRGRVIELVGEDFPAEKLARLKPRQLKQAGLSGNKQAFMLDLCAAVNDGRVNLARIGRKSDDEIIEELIQVKGIGRWTAQMFLMFSLGRIDVFPVADLGVRAGMKALYKLDELPTHPEAEALAARWRPYSTVASWYCWRSLELARTKPTT